MSGASSKKARGDWLAVSLGPRDTVVQVRSRLVRLRPAWTQPDAESITHQMDYWQILILAIIQGAAELLPVSSSAHVIVAAKLMRADTSAPEFVFLLVMLHTGTMLAVICYFWSRWKRLLSTSAAGRLGGAGWLRLVLLVVIATGCTGVVGLALKWIIERA